LSSLDGGLLEITTSLNLLNLVSESKRIYNPELKIAYNQTFVNAGIENRLGFSVKKQQEDKLIRFRFLSCR